MIHQFLSLIGAALVLTAYFGSQSKKISEVSLFYYALNFFGSGILAVLSWRMKQYGFVLINGAWVLITVTGFLTKRDKR